MLQINQECQEFGSSMGSFMTFDDTLGPISYLSFVRIFFNQASCLVGIHTCYNNDQYLSNGCKIANNDSPQNFMTSDACVEPGEYFVSIECCCSNSIDYLKFTTSLGRISEFGKKTQVDLNRRLAPPNSYVKGLAYSLGVSSLQYLKVVYAPFVQSQAYQNQNIMPVTCMTQQFADINLDKVKKIVDVASSAIPCAIKDESKKVAVNNTVGKSNMIGESMPSDPQFDDSNIVKLHILGGKMVHLHNISIFHDSQCITGLTVNFDVYKDFAFKSLYKIYSEIHVKEPSNSKHIKKDYTFGPHEFITSIVVTYDGSINSIKVCTNKGAEISAGSNAGSKLAIKVPLGRRICGFCGSFGSKLNNIAALYY